MSTLQELVLEDSLGGKVSKTLLFKLAEHNALSHFHKVVLLFSPKDQYVPAYSARIQVSDPKWLGIVGQNAVV